MTPAGIVAVCSFLDVPLATALGAARGRPSLVAICADVRDPGNAGTLIRTADALGADAVVLAGHSVDPYNPKTVRASVGSLFHLPLALEPDPALAVRAAQERGLVVLAADGDGRAGPRTTPPTCWPARRPGCSATRPGASPPSWRTLADHRVRIPIRGRAESLNLATAAAICLHESARAR